MKLRRVGRRSSTNPPHLRLMAGSHDPTVSLKQWVADHLKKDFKEAMHLTIYESENDPPEEPFRSLYAARELLTGMKAKLDSCPDQLKEEDFRVISSCVLLELGLNYITGEELSQGEQTLEACLRQLDGIPNKVKTALVSIQAHNQLGVLWGNRNEQQKALEFLLKSKAIYESHIALPPPMTESQWIEGEEVIEWKREKAFEKYHTLTLFYLAQVYGNLDQPKLSAQYCQTTLSRQLETKEYDAIEWSLNCATLSQYYVSSGNFTQARHCLAAASCVLQQFKAEESTLETTGERETGGTRMSEKVVQTEADISRCWVKYCISLLTSSQERQEEGTSEDDIPRQKQFKFDTLEVTDVELSVSSDLIESYEGAKQVFLVCQKHIELSKQYYTLEEYASEHVKIIQDHSNSYKLLSYFETSLEMKCRMHKRRIDMLAALLKELNPQYYLNEHRQIIFEVAGAQSEMADHKTVSASDSPSEHAVGKINKLLHSSIGMYEKFLATFHDLSTRELPDVIDKDYLRPILSSKLYIARLYSKIINPDTAVQVSPNQTSLGTCTCEFGMLSIFYMDV